MSVKTRNACPAPSNKHDKSEKKSGSAPQLPNPQKIKKSNHYRLGGRHVLSYRNHELLMNYSVMVGTLPLIQTLQQHPFLLISCQQSRWILL